MITGDKEREIKAYIMIDRLENGICWVEPCLGTYEKIIGIPFGFHADNSMPFIEHRANGRVTKTVNVADVSKIEFWIHIPPYDPVAEGHDVVEGDKCTINGVGKEYVNGAWINVE